MINSPENSLWTQTNLSDLFGNIFISKNISFDELGYLRLSYSPRLSYSNTQDTDFDNPAVIIWSEENGYYVATWDDIFDVDLRILSTSPVQVVTTGVPSTDIETDATWFGGLLVVTQDTDVDYYDPVADTWTDTNISLTGDGQHPCVSFISLSALAIANVNTVGLYATPISATPTLLTTLTINADFEITSMVYFNQNLYIGTRNKYNQDAYLYIWNGTGTAAQEAYKVDSNIIFSLCVHKNGVWLTTGDGALLRFNGGGFEFIAGFPIYYTDMVLTDSDNTSIYKNTIKSDGNNLFILISNRINNNNRMIQMPDGVWCYNENVGLYHRYSLSNSLVSTENIVTTNVNTTTNVVTVASAPVTGTQFVYRSSSTPISPLIDEKSYFVIKLTSTTIQIAETKEDAINGVAIDLTTTGNNSQEFVYFPNIDYGQYFTNRVTAMEIIRKSEDKIYGTDIMWGGEVYNRANSDVDSFGTVSYGVESRGYFITKKFLSPNITDNYNKFTLKYLPFTSELDKIVIKYRTQDDMRKYIDTSDWEITWTSSTTFTTTQTAWAEAEAKNEVEILRGAAGGLLAHIVSISENAGTYTVTIDETYDNYQSGDKSVAVFSNWKKLKTIEYGTSNANKGFYEADMGSEGKFIQFKIELRGINVTIEEYKVDNVTRLPVKDK